MYVPYRHCRCWLTGTTYFTPKCNRDVVHVIRYTCASAYTSAVTMFSLLFYSLLHYKSSLTVPLHCPIVFSQYCVTMREIPCLLAKQAHITLRWHEMDWTDQSWGGAGVTGIRSTDTEGTTSMNQMMFLKQRSQHLKTKSYLLCDNFTGWDMCNINLHWTVLKLFVCLFCVSNCSCCILVIKHVYY